MKFQVKFFCYSSELTTRTLMVGYVSLIFAALLSTLLRVFGMIYVDEATPMYPFTYLSQITVTKKIQPGKNFSITIENFDLKSIKFSFLVFLILCSVTILGQVVSSISAAILIAGIFKVRF
jgi:hypothetical protein